jgi:UDP-N-acetylmuramate--alanine ligase
VAGKFEPLFVPEVGALAQAILDNARDGDVVLCMGAGSIGAVAAQVRALADATEQPALEPPPDATPASTTSPKPQQEPA